MITKIGNALDLYVDETDIFQYVIFKLSYYLINLSLQLLIF